MTTTDSDGGSASANSVVFALSRADIVIISVGCVAIGVALGFFLPAIGGFAARFPAVLGIIAAFVICGMTTPLRIDDEGIVVGRQEDHPLRISRASFSTAYFDGGELTILTEGGHQAFKGDVEGKKDDVAEAFRSRGYRWGEI